MQINWNDQCGLKYKLLDNMTLIISGDISSEITDTLIDNINSLPYYVREVIINVKASANDVASFNALFDSLADIRTNRIIILSLNRFNMKFGSCVKLNYKNLPDNVKITNLFDNWTEAGEFEYCEANDFDWWALRLNDVDYRVLLSKLTPNARKRATEMRNIAKSFYDKYPHLRNLNAQEKMDFAYDWCLKNIGFELAATTDTGLKPGCEYSQDPIMTFKRKTGVCAGRSGLLKVILNNYYLKCPCFLTQGILLASTPDKNKYHVWNELRDINGVSYYDLSFKNLNGVDENEIIKRKHVIKHHDDYNFYIEARMMAKPCPPPMPKESICKYYKKTLPKIPWGNI